jgi:hypothetical protein
MRKNYMKSTLRIVLFVLAVLIAGSIGFLATWDTSAPVSTVEKVLPDARFPR